MKNLLFILTVFIYSCTPIKKEKTNHKIVKNGDETFHYFYENKKLMRVKRYKNGFKKNEIIYNNSKKGLIKYYRLTGKTKSIISLINGTNKINTHLEFDINGKIIPNESNILLKKEQNKLKVSFFEPYPDEIEICFYNDFKSEQVKCLSYNESKKLKDIYIDISSYQDNNLNLLIKRIRHINNVKTIIKIYRATPLNRRT